MSITLVLKGTETSVRLEEIRRFQVYRLERPRRRPLLQRLRRTLRAHFYR
jgi:hypothetical protein